MENVVKYFDTIEVTIRKNKIITVSAVIGAVIVCVCSAIVSLYGVLVAKSQVYVIQNGTAIMATAAAGNVEKDLEIKDHVIRFHELMFNLSPSAESIKRNIDRALVMSDRSAYDYWMDLSERGFYHRLVSANISQEIVIDSVRVNVANYPYDAKAFGKLYLLRESNITSYQFESSCRMVDVERSETNPHGLMIEKFMVNRNEIIGTKKRK